MLKYFINNSKFYFNNIIRYAMMHGLNLTLLQQYKFFTLKLQLKPNSYFQLSFDDIHAPCWIIYNNICIQWYLLFIKFCFYQFICCILFVNLFMFNFICFYLYIGIYQFLLNFFIYICIFFVNLLMAFIIFCFYQFFCLYLYFFC